MPRLAIGLLIRRLERSGRFDRAVGDARSLFRRRLRFHSLEKERADGLLGVELRVGAVELGALSLPASGLAREDEALRRWLELVAHDLAEHLSSPHGHGREVLPAGVATAAQIIRDQHTEPLTLGEVARAVKLSRERLSRLFHETLGITFSEYLNHARLESARRLLRETPHSFTEVAFASGF